MESLKKLFNCEVYLRLDVTTPKNLCICDYDKEHIYTDYDLIKVFDYFKYKDPVKFLHFITYNDDLFINGKKPLDLSREVALSELIQNSSKEKGGYFTKFKDILFLYIKTVHSLNFEPSNKRIINLNNKEYLNIYFQKKLIKNIKPNIKAEFPYISKILFNVTGNNEKYYEHFKKHLAFKIQNPDKQIPTHWVIIDNGGTGKTTFLANEIMSKIFEIALITQSDLESNYTHYINKKQYVICEEIESFSNNKKLKALTGSKTITIDEKYKAQYEITNYCTFIIFSNDMKAIHIDDRDRRWNVIGGGKKLYAFDNDWKECLFESEKENKEFFDNFNKNLHEEVKSFYSYLLALPVEQQEVFKVLDTELKRNICEMSKPSYDSFINEIINSNLTSIINTYSKQTPGDFEKYNIIGKSKGDNKGYWIKATGIYNLYTKYCLETGHKPISKNNFSQRIWKHKFIHLLFTESKVISHEGNKFQAYLIHTYKDENIEKEVPEITNMN